MSPEAMLQEAEIWENHGFGTKQAKKKKKNVYKTSSQWKKAGYGVARLPFQQQRKV
jgi:hypothetical protein